MNMNKTASNVLLKISKISLLPLIFIFLILFMLNMPLFPMHGAFAAQDKTEIASKDKTGDEAITDSDLKKERKIGRKALLEIEKSWPLLAEPARLAHLEMILMRLKPYMEREIPYEVRIVDSEAINAFCLTGGFIFFTTGLLDILHTDAEIAAIMAHEMVHADQKHSLKMAAKSEKVSLAALAVMLLSGGSVAPIVLAQVAEVAITNSYAIEFEKEADDKALTAIMAAKYWPSAMLTVMEKFMNEELKQPIRDYGIYMTHPEAQERIDYLTKKLKALGITIERKHPLGVLRTGFSESKDRLELTIDGMAVWGGKKTPEVRQTLEQARNVLDRHFQMETAPHDLRLENDTLFIKNIVIAKKTKGAQELKIFRKNLLDALGRSRLKHPSAKYYQ